MALRLSDLEPLFVQARDVVHSLELATNHAVVARIAALEAENARGAADSNQGGQAPRSVSEATTPAGGTVDADTYTECMDKAAAATGSVNEVKVFNDDSSACGSDNITSTSSSSPTQVNTTNTVEPAAVFVAAAKLLNAELVAAVNGIVQLDVTIDDSVAERWTIDLVHALAFCVFV